MKTKKPNIVLIIIDALRQDHLSCYGYPKKTSPNIDKIAKEGLLFENFYSTSCWTVPSHASLFTGLYPTEHQTNDGESLLNPNLLSLPEKLKNQGYTTIGFSDNPYISKFLDFSRGFDLFEDPFFREDIIDWRTFVKKRKHKKGIAKYIEILKYLFEQKKEGKKFLSSIKTGIQLKFFEFFEAKFKRGDKGAKRVLQKIKKEKSKLLKEPYFLFINFMEVHGPYRPPLRYSPFLLNHPFWFFLAPYPNAWDYYVKGKDFFKEIDQLLPFYDAEIRYIDKIIGDLFEELKSKNTIFIITSDHGEKFGEKGQINHIYSLDEVLIKIPLIIWGCGKGRIKKFFQLTDLHWGIVELAGLKENPPWHSFSIFGNFEKPSVFCEYFLWNERYLRKKYPLSIVKKYFDHQIKAIIKDQWKYIKNFTTKKEELYFLKDDPQEKNDLSSKNPEVLEKMRNLLNDFLSKLQKCENVKKTQEKEDIQKHLQALGYI